MTRKEFKAYLKNVITDISDRQFLEEIGQTLLGKDQVKYVCLADEYEVMEDD